MNDRPPFANIFRRGRGHRGFIMLAVLVCMMSAIFVATALLFLSQTESAGAAGSADAAQRHALQWSGMQVVMRELEAQRDRLLAGERPELQRQYVVYQNASRIGVVRLLPVSSDASHVAFESAKLDMNSVTADTLTRTGLLDRAQAENLIRWRDGMSRPIQSIHELLDASGINARLLYGPLEELVTDSTAFSRDDGSRVRGLADVLTVFAVEPAVQNNGRLRINLNVPWSEELGQAIEERFGADAAGLMKQVFESGATFEDDAALVRAMISYGTPLAQWPEILDAFTTQAGGWHYGRLNVNQAPREALLGLPGVTSEQVDQIISARQDLTQEERLTRAWPVLREILSPEQFATVAGLLSTRSWTFRMRLASGEVDADTPDAPLTRSLVHELVIDCAGPRPRIAYLRDITLLRDAAHIAINSSRATASAGFEAELRRQPSEPVVAVNVPATRRDDHRFRVETQAQMPAADQDAGDRRIGRWTRGRAASTP